MPYYSLPSRDRMEGHIHQRLNSLATELSVSSEYVVYVLECGRDILSGEREEWGRKVYDESDEYDLIKYYDASVTEDGSSNGEWKKRFPNWFKRIRSADSIYYVGYTNNLPRRLFAHIYPTKDGALFTRLFEPNALVAMREYGDHKKAKEGEAEISGRLDDFTSYKKLKEPRMVRGLEREARQDSTYIERLREGFDRSDNECMMDFVLDREISRPSTDDYVFAYRCVYELIQYKHLKECKEYCKKQSCYCHIDDSEKRFNKVLDKLQSFYQGAYLYYRGLIRRIKTGLLCSNYSM